MAKKKKNALLVAGSLAAGILSVVIIAMFAFIRTGGPDDFRNGHAPGSKETRGDLTIYHLQDGVFVHERRAGDDHYFLIEGPMSSFETTSEGLRMVLDWEKTGFILTASQTRTLSTPRQPAEWIVGFLDTSGRNGKRDAEVDQQDDVGTLLASMVGEFHDRGATRMSTTEACMEVVRNFTRTPR